MILNLIDKKKVILKFSKDQLKNVFTGLITSFIFFKIELKIWNEFMKEFKFESYKFRRIYLSQLYQVFF